MSFGVHPHLLMAAVGVLMALMAAIVVCNARTKSVKAAMITLMLFCLLPALYLLQGLRPELLDARFRTYKAFYAEIQPGMTRAEVLSLLDHHYPASGKRLRPQIEEDTPVRLGFFMNPESSREPNCEGIFLDLEKGRVRSKSYSAD